jgi:Arc/MetJ-type ribon-helix-helix transcriptional regulator
MTTISIPITTELNEFINEQIRLGKASSKAEFIRRAIIKFKEEEFIKDIREAQQEIKDGKGMTGDLDKLAEGFE